MEQNAINGPQIVAVGHKKVGIWYHLFSGIMTAALISYY